MTEESKMDALRPLVKISLLTQVLRPQGYLEKYEAVRYARGLYRNLATSASYVNPAPSTTSGELQSLVYRALGQVISQHPILSTVFMDAGDKTSEPYFARLPQVDLRECVHFVARTKRIDDDQSEDDEELDQLLEAQHNVRFDERWGELPLWRLIILHGEGEEGLGSRFTACFVHLHSIADGNSGPAFHRAFLSALSAAPSSGKQDGPADPIVRSPDLPIPPSVESVHPLPVSLICLATTVWNQLAPSWNGNRVWTGPPVAASAGQLPVHSRFRSFALPAATTKKLRDVSRAHGTSLTGTCHALLCLAIFAHIPPEKTVVKSNISISMRRWLDPEASGVDGGAIGNWVSNYYSDQRREALVSDFWAEARRIKGAVDEEIGRRGRDTVIGLLKHVGSNSAMHGLFAGRVGKPRERTFVLSNLGAFKAPANSDGSGWRTGRMVFSQSFDPSGEVMQVMLVTGEDGRLSIGFVWGDDIGDDDLVPNIMEALKKSLVDAADDQDE